MASTTHLSQAQPRSTNKQVPHSTHDNPSCSHLASQVSSYSRRSSSAFFCLALVAVPNRSPPKEAHSAPLLHSRASTLLPRFINPTPELSIRLLNNLHIKQVGGCVEGSLERPDVGGQNRQWETTIVRNHGMSERATGVLLPSSTQ